MAIGKMGTHGQRGIEQQHALRRPTGKVARLRNGLTEVLFYLLIYINERWRQHYSVRDGKAQSHCLTGLMIGVLSDNDHLHPVKRAKVEGIEDEPARRIAGLLPVLLPYKSGKLAEIGLVKLRLQMFLPRRFDVYFHRAMFLVCCKNTTKQRDGQEKRRRFLSPAAESDPPPSLPCAIFRNRMLRLFCTVGVVCGKTIVPHRSQRRAKP